MKKIDVACVIDDDEFYKYTIKRMIGKTGIAEKTLFFSNGKVALDFFKENKDAPEQLPDLILLDINMPVLDGWQFMDQFVLLLPEIKKQIKIYIVSSSVDEDDQNHANRFEQVAGFVVKPITNEFLTTAVSDIGH
jgi:CheY-like chemotaxis protein